MRGSFLKSLRHPVTQNALALFSVQFSNYLLVLIIMPYMMRRLGPESWGIFGIFQSLAMGLAVILEYGFDFSATRHVARWRNYRTHLTRIATGVVGVKLLLLVGSGTLAAATMPLVPVFREHPKHLLWAWLWAAGIGLRPIWYFQGIEKLKLAAFLEFVIRLVATGSVFAMVRGPGDGWKVLALYGTASLLATGINLLRMYRRLPFRWPTWTSTTANLRLGLSMFVFRGAVIFYTRTNTFVLGLLLPGSPALVGYFDAAEKIIRALLGLMGATSQAFYPRISHLVHYDRREAVRLVRISFAVLMGIATAAGITTYIGAPLTPALFGSKYGAVVPLLRLLVFLLPIGAINNVLGIQWMLPLGLDRPVNVIIITAGLLNLTAAVVFVPLAGPRGMIAAVTLAELFVASSMYVTLRRRGLEPLLNLSRAK